MMNIRPEVIEDKNTKGRYLIESKVYFQAKVDCQEKYVPFLRSQTDLETSKDFSFHTSGLPKTPPASIMTPH